MNISEILNSISRGKFSQFSSSVSSSDITLTDLHHFFHKPLLEEDYVEDHVRLHNLGGVVSTDQQGDMIVTRPTDVATFLSETLESFFGYIESRGSRVISGTQNEETASLDFQSFINPQMSYKQIIDSENLDQQVENKIKSCIDNLRRGIMKGRVLPVEDHDLQERLDRNEITQEQANLERQVIEHKLENFIKEMDAIDEKEHLDSFSTTNSHIYLAQRVAVLIDCLYHIENELYTVGESKKQLSISELEQKFQETKDAFFEEEQEERTEQHQSNNGIIQVLNDLGLDTRLPFVQAGILIFGMKSYGQKRQDFIELVRKTCRHCATKIKATSNSTAYSQTPPLPRERREDESKRRRVEKLRTRLPKASKRFC